MKNGALKRITKPLSRLSNRDFWRGFFPLAVPIVLQQLLMCTLNLVDTLMVGKLGDAALASVGVAGQLSFFIFNTIFGVASGGAVFIAQYHGAGDKRGIHRTMGAMLSLSVPLSILMCVLCLSMPEKIAAIFTDDAAMIAGAADYLSFACFSYVGMALTQTMSIVLRSTENVRLPMFSSMAASVTNVILNYIFIFGKLGAPALGVGGAALATAISTFVNAGILFTVSLIKRNIMIAPLSEIFDISRDFYKKFLLRALPVLANEAAWSFGVMGYNMVLGRYGTENYAALTICRTVEDFAYVFFVGLCNACNIMVGKRVGADDIEEAKDYSRCFMLLVPLAGLAIGMGVIAARPLLISLFSVTDVTRSVAKTVMLIYGLEITLRNIPYIGIVGIFRAGGDTKTGLRYDLLCLYCVSLPIVAASGFFLKLPFLTVYLLMLLCEDIPKTILCLRHFASMKWIRPVTDKKIESPQ